jgi:hypothetical protein
MLNLKYFILTRRFFMSLSIGPIIVERRSDTLGVVGGPIDSKVSMKQIASASASKLPSYAPDNASAILVFHTASKAYILGPVRTNKCLHEPGKEVLTTDGTQFPLQISASIGGRYTEADKPFRSAVIDRMNNRMYILSALAGAEKAQEILKKLTATVQTDEGWENKVCVHTDKWGEGEGDKMCVLTGVKHIACSEIDIIMIETALKEIMDAKKTAGGKPWEVADYKFIELTPIIESSKATYLDDEIVKARKAYEQFKDTVAVTFNDLAVATLTLNGAFQERTFAQLNLS